MALSYLLNVPQKQREQWLQEATHFQFKIIKRFDLTWFHCAPVTVSVQLQLVATAAEERTRLHARRAVNRLKK